MKSNPLALVLVFVVCLAAGIVAIRVAGQSELGAVMIYAGVREVLPALLSLYPRKTPPGAGP